MLLKFTTSHNDRTGGVDPKTFCLTSSVVSLDSKYYFLDDSFCTVSFFHFVIVCAVFDLAIVIFHFFYAIVKYANAISEYGIFFFQ